MFVDSILQEKGTGAVTIAAEATVGDVVATLASKNIGALVVVEDGDRVVGIISERDVVRHLARNAAGLLERPVSGLMTREPTTCKRGDTLDWAMGQMTRGRFRHLPVVEDGHLVGVISIGDVVKRKIEIAEQEAGALREYIAS